MPETSVIIPAYNYAAYTVAAVESILGQTYRDYEIIVVDDGSTDNTQLHLQPFIDRRQIRYLHQENHGAAHARNAGLNQAQGEFLAFLDCDDQYHPRKLELSLAVLKMNPSAGLVYTPVLFLSESGHLLGRDRERGYTGSVFPKLVQQNFVRNSTPVIRRRCLERAGGQFDESFFYAADWEMWLRLASLFPFVFLARPLTRYRRRENDYFVQHPLEVKAELVRLAGKIFQRHPELSSCDRNNLLGRIAFWTAKAYLAKQNWADAHRELQEAQCYWPDNSRVRLLALLISRGLFFLRLLYPLRRFFRRLRWF